jgi:hypothetical protein
MCIGQFTVGKGKVIVIVTHCKSFKAKSEKQGLFIAHAMRIAQMKFKCLPFFLSFCAFFAFCLVVGCSVFVCIDGAIMSYISPRCGAGVHAASFADPRPFPAARKARHTA